MATRSTNVARNFELGDMNDYPVIAADIIYEGSAVGDNASGYARPLVAGDPFLGFCYEKADNSAGSAGDINVKVRSKGRVQLSITSLAITDRGKDVYASDDDTFTLTAGSNTRIGFVSRWVSTGIGIVEFEAQSGLQGVSAVTQTSAAPAAATAAALTDNSTGTSGSGTIGAVSDVATAANAIATLAEEINLLITDVADLRTQLAAEVVDTAALTALVNTLLARYGG